MRKHRRLLYESNESVYHCYDISNDCKRRWCNKDDFAAAAAAADSDKESSC